MPIDPQLLADGMRHHRNGEIAQAQAIYRQLLATDPHNAALLNLLGAAAFGLGQLQEAGDYLHEALRLDPGLAGAHDNLGLVLAAQNRFDEAIPSFRRAVAANPRNMSSKLNLALALVRGGENEAAIAELEQIVQASPDNLAARAELGRLLCLQGRPADALVHLRHRTELSPDNAEAHFELGTALSQAGQPWPAIASYQAGLRLKPSSAAGCAELAKLYFDLKLYDEAVHWSRQAVELQPELAHAHCILGRTLAKQEKHSEAITSLQTAVRLDPHLGEANEHLGAELIEEGRFDAALEHFRREVTLAPDDPVAHYNLGYVHIRLGDLPTALAQLDRAIELNPEYADAQVARGVALLFAGELAEGFSQYEWRLRLPTKYFASLPFPMWNGEPLAGRTIVLNSEQGLGDTLQFVRYAPLLKLQGARVLVCCKKVLQGILARTPGVDGFVTPNDQEIDADFSLPMMSLPYRLRTTAETVPATIPYIFADERLVESWRQRLSALEGFKVGIVWHGSGVGDLGRSIPLSSFAPLANIAGVRLVNLQKGPGLDQLRAVAKPWSVSDFSSEVDTSTGAFMDTAAIMKNLDLVITADTAPAHLAGALGVNVWVAVQKMSEWRWMLERADSPWYPTMRLFRQTRWRDWSGVFERIQTALKEMV